MNVRRFAAAGSLILACAGGVTVAAGPANAAACKTTNTFTHKVTSQGSTSDEWVKRVACGKPYQRWEHLVSHSYTGSHYDEHVYRDERAYPHYRQVTDKVSWSKTGVQTHTVTVKTG